MVPVLSGIRVSGLRLNIPLNTSMALPARAASLLCLIEDDGAQSAAYIVVGLSLYQQSLSLFYQA